jgi:hypothetical protein
MATIKVEIELDVSEENFEQREICEEIGEGSIYVQRLSFYQQKRALEEELGQFFIKCQRISSQFSALKGHLKDFKINVTKGEN